MKSFLSQRQGKKRRLLEESEFKQHSLSFVFFFFSKVTGHNLRLNINSQWTLLRAYLCSLNTELSRTIFSSSSMSSLGRSAVIKALTVTDTSSGSWVSDKAVCTTYKVYRERDINIHIHRYVCVCVYMCIYIHTYICLFRELKYWKSRWLLKTLSGKNKVASQQKTWNKNEGGKIPLNSSHKGLSTQIHVYPHHVYFQSPEKPP